MELSNRQIEEVCRFAPTRSKWILIPSRALGHTLGERLAREGAGWANLRFTPPIDLALQMAAPYLVERGIDPVPYGIGPALITRLLLDLPRATPAYFRPLGEHPRMADALWAAFRELRMAGLTAADLPRDAFASAAKHAELRALLQAYEAHLADRGLADAALVYREALRHREACPIRADDLLLEWPDVAWAPLERRFLDALPGDRVRARVLDVPGLERPRRLDRLAAPVELVSPAEMALTKMAPDPALEGAAGAEAGAGRGGPAGPDPRGPAPARAESHATTGTGEGEWARMAARGQAGLAGQGWQGLVLPALTLALPAAAMIARLTRSALLEVLGEDYLRAARAKGLPEGRVIFRHALRNALISVVTFVGLQFGLLLGGSVVVESLFSRQGLGQLVIAAVFARDIPIVQGWCLLIAVAYSLVNLAVDLSYAVLNPRIRYDAP